MPTVHFQDFITHLENVARNLIHAIYGWPVSTKVIVIGGVVFLYGAHKSLFDKIKYRVPPGPTPLPFIGSIWYLAWRGSKIGFLGMMSELERTYGPIYTIYNGSHRTIYISDAPVINNTFERELGRIAMSARYEPQAMPGFEVMGRGLSWSSGELWRNNRKFCVKGLRDVVLGKDTVLKKVHEDVAALLADFEAKKKQPFNPKRRITNAISNIVCSFVFGKRYESIDDPEFVQLLEMMERGFEQNFVQMLAFGIFPMLGNVLTPSIVKAFWEVNDFVKGIVITAIADHRPTYNAENIRDFPDLFIQAEQLGDASVSLETFLPTVVDLFAAGTESTSTVLTWAILYMTKFPEIQRKCHDLIDQVIESDRLPTQADRTQLVYIDAVINELLRHVSVSHLSLSHCNESQHIKISGYDIPPWSNILFNIKAVHYDPSYWKDPESFDPQRWIGEEGKLLVHSFHFLPFGLGPRICPGQALARIELFVFLTALLHRFEFKLATENVRLDQGIYGMVHMCPAYEVEVIARH